VQRVGTARFLGEDITKVHDPVWGVLGTLGDSQCYLGVNEKVAAVGLFAWIVHLVSGSNRAAWVSVIALVPLVILGLVMLAVWLDGRSSSDNVDPKTRPPEQWFPSSIVVLHGVGALLTVVLVVVAAVRS
jgi:hypothetical protein